MYVDHRGEGRGGSGKCEMPPAWIVKIYRGVVGLEKTGRTCVCRVVGGGRYAWGKKGSVSKGNTEGDQRKKCFMRSKCMARGMGTLLPEPKI